MTIPPSLLSLYDLSDAAELDVDRLLWDRPARIALLEDVAAEAKKSFGASARLSLISVERVVDLASMTTEPGSEQLSLGVHHSLRDQALSEASEEFQVTCGRRLLDAGILWHLVPSPKRRKPEEIQQITDGLKRSDA